MELVKIFETTRLTSKWSLKGAYDDQQTGIGLILGTGSNAAYLEDAEKVLNWHGKRPNDVKEVIIDPEFGAFGDNHCIDFIKTEFDKELDNDSLLPGSFTYEKYFAGKYIGEIVRLALVQLHKINIFMSNNKNDSIFKKDSLTAKMVSDILEDNFMTKRIPISRRPWHHHWSSQWRWLQNYWICLFPS